MAHRHQWPALSLSSKLPLARASFKNSMLRSTRHIGLQHHRPGGASRYRGWRRIPKRGKAGADPVSRISAPSIVSELCNARYSSSSRSRAGHTDFSQKNCGRSKQRHPQQLAIFPPRPSRVSRRKTGSCREEDEKRRSPDLVKLSPRLATVLLPCCI
ncbi:hypothetical protein LX36DRAFT_285937 [Colletotrichum falcatum]|nr:hypothetical protein LX36DRAFT_285937 [Colletotrichum falcatum]